MLEPALETMRLRLSPLSPDDAETVFSFTSDEKVARYMRFDTQTAPDQAAELIREYTSDGNRGFLLTSKGEGTPLGVFAFKRDEAEPRVYSLSIFLHPSAWNLGYSTELLGWAASYARKELNARALTAYVVSSNLFSRRSLEKRGFSVADTLTFADLPGGLAVYRKELED